MKKFTTACGAFKKTKGIVILLAIIPFFMSCSAPTYLTAPVIEYPIIENLCSFGIQNMDNDAKVENNVLTCHYDGFDVKYHVEDFIVSLTVINNSNKSLIIDKSKCYVLYNGYATQMFKDVRSTRSTTFNNVQDAINNVQTTEGGVSMTIPPYSKWELPLNETNVRKLEKLPEFNYTIGVHALSSFDNPETVEFIIPYSFDYSMAKWETCRNRIYVNSIVCKSELVTNMYKYRNSDWTLISDTQYKCTRQNGIPDYAEANRIDDINQKKWRKHNKSLLLHRLLILGGGCHNPDHLPYLYGDGSVKGVWHQ